MTMIMIWCLLGLLLFQQFIGWLILGSTRLAAIARAGYKHSLREFSLAELQSIRSALFVPLAVQ